MTKKKKMNASIRHLKKSNGEKKRRQAPLDTPRGQSVTLREDKPPARKRAQ
ncbi:MAG: hypothetical protein AAF471_07305 [Myxococcota bacterium]